MKLVSENYLPDSDAINIIRVSTPRSSLKELCHQGTAGEVNDSDEGNNRLYVAHVKLTYYIFTAWGLLTNCMILKRRYLTQQSRQVSPSDSVSHSDLHSTSVPCLISSSLSLCIAIRFPRHADLAEFIYKARGLSVSSFCIALRPAIVGISCSKRLAPFYLPHADPVLSSCPHIIH